MLARSSPHLVRGEEGRGGRCTLLSRLGHGLQGPEICAEVWSFPCGISMVSHGLGHKMIYHVLEYIYMDNRFSIYIYKKLGHI